MCLWQRVKIKQILLVGYGDIVPITLLGRFITGIAILFGVCIISLCVVAFTEFLALDPKEKQVKAIKFSLKIRFMN